MKNEITAAVIERLERENAELRRQLEAALSRDITERKRAEEERRAYLRHLETMDRVNCIIHETSDLDQMMSDLLDVMLEVFDCDRAFLLYPCDPEASAWRAPMERTRPEYPGALVMGMDMPMDPWLAAAFRTVLAANGPVQFDLGCAPMPAEVTERFSIKSILLMAIFPKVGKPWEFGLHHCSRPRVWTEEEMTLFQAVGSRLADALTSLMAYRELCESEEKYRLVVDNSTDSLFLLEVTGDRRFRNLLVNRAFEESVGMDGRQLVGKFQEETVPEETAQTVIAKYRRCVETGAVTTEEAELDLPVGRRAFRSTLIPVRNANGRVHRLVGVTRDITERKRAERVAQARLRLLETAQTADMSLDETLRGMLDEIEALTGSSIGFYHFMEEDQQTILKQGWSSNTLASMCSAEGKGRHYAVAEAGVWADCVRERRPVIHNDYASLPNRRVMPVGHAPVVRELVVPVFRGDRIVAIIGVGNKPEEYNDTDVQIVSLLGDFSWEIVTRRQAEEKLRTSEREFRTLAENSPDPIIRYARDGRRLYVNPATERISGKPAHILLGHIPSDGQLVSSPEAEKIVSWVRQVAETGLPIEGEIEFVKPDGEIRYFCNRYVPEWDNDGAVASVLSIDSDITVRKQTEKELQAKNSELERFTYTVSHDLKSPLVTIKSFSGSIKKDLASGRRDRLEKDLDRICAAADKMATLLDDLLKLSRVGRVINTPEPVDMAKLVDDVLNTMAGTLKENGVVVTVHPGLPTVSCDRQRMMEVVQNLIENAVKYRGDQPGPRIVIGLRINCGRQVLFVQDNGSGIDPKYHENIFGLFNRLNTRVPGTGIGLALVKRIIETHGGSIWVESDGQGNGSTFCFTVG